MVKFIHTHWWGENCHGNLSFGDAWKQGTKAVFGRSTTVQGVSQTPPWFREAYKATPIPKLNPITKQLLKPTPTKVVPEKPVQKVEALKVRMPEALPSAITVPPVMEKPKYVEPVSLSESQLEKLADMVARKLGHMLKLALPAEEVKALAVEVKRPKKLLIIGLLDSQIAPLKKEFEGCFDIKSWKEESFQYLKTSAEAADIIMTTRYMSHSATAVIKKHSAKVKPFVGRHSTKSIIEFLTTLYSTDEE